MSGSSSGRCSDRPCHFPWSCGTMTLACDEPSLPALLEGSFQLPHGSLGHPQGNNRAMIAEVPELALVAGVIQGLARSDHRRGAARGAAAPTSVAMEAGNWRLPGILAPAGSRRRRQFTPARPRATRTCLQGRHLTRRGQAPEWRHWRAGSSRGVEVFAEGNR
jgi:hypothetical protein